MQFHLTYKIGAPWHLTTAYPPNLQNSHIWKPRRHCKGCVIPMNSEATPATATLTKIPNTGLYPSSRQAYARLECKQGKARLTSDPQPSRAKLAPIRAATDIANPTISTPAIASNRQTTAGLNPKMPDDHSNSAPKPAGASLSQCVYLP